MTLWTRWFKVTFFWDGETWPLQRLSDLQIGDKKVTKNHLGDVFCLIWVLCKFLDFNVLHSLCCPPQSLPCHQLREWQEAWRNTFLMRANACWFLANLHCSGKRWIPMLIIDNCALESTSIISSNLPRSVRISWPIVFWFSTWICLSWESIRGGFVGYKATNLN